MVWFPRNAGTEPGEPDGTVLARGGGQGGSAQAVRFGKWKAVQQNLNKDPNAPVEIYDLTADIGEAKNIAAANPQIVERAKAIFAEAHTPSDLWKFGGKKPSKPK